MHWHPVMRHRDYLDPAESFARDEAKGCKGCNWEHRLLGPDLPRCGQGKRYGTRCGKYSERKGAKVLL